MLTIYSKYPEWLSEWRGNSLKKLHHTNSLDECFKQPYKVIIVQAFCDDQSTHAFSPEFLDFDWAKIDLVLIKETLWATNKAILEDFVKKNKIKNFIISSHNPSSEYNLFNPDWLLKPVARLRPKPVNYNKVQSSYKKNKKYFFDVLLGYPRPHRFFILGKLLKNKFLLDNSVVTFRKEFLFEGDDIQNIWNETNIQIRNLLDNKLTYPFEHNMNNRWENMPPNDLSRAYFLNGNDIPWKIYENTWYSICNETAVPEHGPNGSIPRVSEKSGRLFLAKRVFVMFGHRGNLKLLRELGFKTFDCIIDESYDLESNSFTRYEKAWQQVEKLTKLDPIEVLKQTEYIREHNFKRLVELRTEIRNQANKMLISKIPQEFCY